MKKRALVGHTGFVGTNLKAQSDFTHVYRSTDIDSIRGLEFDEVVCAGAPAVKWLANREPEADRASLARLTDALSEVEAGRFTLVSTVDVYPAPGGGADERADPAGLPNHAYGTHRLGLEDFVRARFASHVVARLPALFGRGLRKNVLFDLLTGNQVGSINPASSFQWYPLGRLTGDLDLAASLGLGTVNLVTAPVATSWIVETLFPGAAVGQPSAPAPSYDLRTAHSDDWGCGQSGYVAPEREVRSELARFVDAARRAPAEWLGA